MRNHTSTNAGGYVWLISGISLIIYASLILSNQSVPGVEQLIDALSEIETTYIFLTAFVVIFIEGLYFIGSFFPGSSTVLILAILSQTNGFGPFLITILLIFTGWSLSSVINIFAARGTQKLRHKNIDHTFAVKDNLWTTWFPAFRANYEVAQVAEGADPVKVLLSSIRVKAIVSMGMLAVTYIFSKLIDLKSISNEEGVSTLFIVAAICLLVGWRKLKRPVVKTAEQDAS